MRLHQRLNDEIAHGCLSSVMIPVSRNGRNQPESAEKTIVSHRKTFEIDGNGSCIPGRKIKEIFRLLPAVSRRTEQEFGRRTQEKSEDFLVWNTASMKSPEFSGTDRFLAVLSNLCSVEWIV